LGAPPKMTLPTAFLSGTAAAGGIALITSRCFTSPTEKTSMPLPSERPPTS